MFEFVTIAFCEYIKITGSILPRFFSSESGDGSLESIGKARIGRTVEACFHFICVDAL